MKLSEIGDIVAGVLTWAAVILVLFWMMGLSEPLYR